MSDGDATEFLRHSCEVHQAEGKLSAMLRVPIEEAVIGLDLLAQFRGVAIAVTAQEILDGSVAGDDVRTTVDEDALTILRRHLDRTTSPLDHAH